MAANEKARYQTDISAEQFYEILAGKRPEPNETYFVPQNIELGKDFTNKHLPTNFMGCWSLTLSNCPNIEAIPPTCEIMELIIKDCPNFTQIGAEFIGMNLWISNTKLARLPQDIRIQYKIELDQLDALTELPDNLDVDVLVINSCPNLETIPEIHVQHLTFTSCTSILNWTEGSTLRVANYKDESLDAKHNITLRGCTRLTSLPSWMNPIHNLDIRDCAAIPSLSNITVTNNLEVGNTNLTALPQTSTASGYRLRWNNVLIEPYIVTDPDQISATDILDEQNAEVRRIKLERMGYEQFFKQANPTERSRDIDQAGNLRLLLEIDPNPPNTRVRDEIIVCLQVIDPSTGNTYVLRVPPNIQTPHEASAWIAGFDNPDLYRPIIEA